MARGRGGEGPKGPLRRWLDGVDRTVDDELNRFFSPEERSRTGEVMDKYYHRVEESILRASEAAKRTKTDLDALGDDYVARIFGGKRRPRSDEANIRWITSRPKTVILAILLITLVVSSPAVYITGVERLDVESHMRADFEIFLPPKDETTLVLNEVLEDWSTDAMFIYVELISTGNLTDLDLLKDLSAIEGDDEHPAPPPAGDGYQSEFNYTRYGIDPWRDDDGRNDGVSAILSIPMLIKTINQTASDLANQLGASTVPGNYSIPNDQALIDRIVEQLPPDILKPMAADTDGEPGYDRFAIIVLLHRDPKIQNQVMEYTERIIAQVNGANEGSMRLYLTGPTPLIKVIQDRTIEEFFKVIWLVILALVVTLALWHQTWRVIPIALIPVTLGLAMALGIVGLLRDYVAITPQVVIVAPVLLALGVSYGLYISNRFAEEEGTEGTREKQLARAVQAINPAIMLSALTTGIGFASLMIGTLPPIFTMGLALTLGILFTYIMTYILVPALIIVTKYRKRTSPKGMKNFSTVPSRNRKKVVLISLVAVVLSVSLIPQVRLDADYLAMAPDDEDVVVKMGEYSRNMGGGQMGMFIVRRDPYEYDTLDSMDAVTQQVNEVPNTQGLSVVAVMQSISVPPTITVLGQEITLPEQAQQSLWDAIVFLQSLPLRGDEMAARLIETFYETLTYEVREMLISTESRRALVYTFMPFMDIDETREAVDGVNAVVAAANLAYQDPSGPEYASKLTGIAAITLAVNDLIIVSQYNSLAVSIFLTFLVLTIIFKSIKVGLITVIPVLTVIALEPGTLVGLGIPLSTITVMIGSIAIGTGVDFSIQISQRVRLGGYKLPAVFNAVEKAGTSFVEATSTMLVGFAMTLFIQIDSIQEFVLMIMILLGYNAVFALILLPSIYTLSIRRQERREERLRQRPPRRARATARDRYERAIKAIFRIRDRPPEGGRQTVLPFEEEGK